MKRLAKKGKISQMTIKRETRRIPVQVSFNKRSYEALIRLKTKLKVSKSEILRNAVILLDCIEEKRSKDEKLAIIKDDKILYEIITTY